MCLSPGGFSTLFSLPRSPMPSDDVGKVVGILNPLGRQASDSGPFSGQTYVRSVCTSLVSAGGTAKHALVG